MSGEPPNNELKLPSLASLRGLGLQLNSVFCGQAGMSTDQSARTAEHELEVVRLEAEERARQELEQAGTLRPFAVTLSDEGELLVHEVSPDGDPGPMTPTETLAAGVRLGMGGQVACAVALARTVLVRDLPGGAARPAVCVVLEHVTGLAKRCFLPYSLDGGAVAWQESRLTTGVPWFFSSGP